MVSDKEKNTFSGKKLVLLVLAFVICFSFLYHMFDMFGDYHCCSVHIDNHTGDWEAKSSRGNRNHSVSARLSQYNDDEIIKG